MFNGLLHGGGINFRCVLIEIILVCIRAVYSKILTMMEVISNCNNNNSKNNNNNSVLINNNCIKTNGQDMKRTVRSVKRKKVKQIKDCCTICDSVKNNLQLTELNRMWNQSGWIRVYCGPYRDVIDYEEPSRMVNVLSNATTKDVIRDMDLPIEYTLWVSGVKFHLFAVVQYDLENLIFVVVV